MVQKKHTGPYYRVQLYRPHLCTVCYLSILGLPAYSCIMYHSRDPYYHGTCSIISIPVLRKVQGLLSALLQWVCKIGPGRLGFLYIDRLVGSCPILVYWDLMPWIQPTAWEKQQKIACVHSFSDGWYQCDMHGLSARDLEVACSRTFSGITVIFSGSTLVSRLR